MIPRICLLVALSALLAAGDAAPILITAYGPFAGRGVNGSETVARRLEGTVIAGHPVLVAVLPVRWGEPARRLPELLQKKPCLVLGLGEGHPGRMTFERQARNRADPIRDEAGQPPPAPRLDPAGPATRASTLRFDPGWFPMPPLPVQASDDAGGYLCNAMLWEAVARARVPVAFVHVPPQGDEPADAFAGRLAPLVRTLIERNLVP